jgi:hypothetical protein
MKYIVLRSKLAGVEQKIPIIFPNFLVHKHVSKYFAGLLIREYGRDSDITVSSAGDINLNDFTCSGKSETCGVSSDPNDQDLIMSFEYTQGVEGALSLKDLGFTKEKI